MSPRVWKLECFQLDDVGGMLMSGWRMQSELTINGSNEGNCCSVKEQQDSGYGASLSGPLCNTHNPTLWLFFGTCLHIISDNDQTRPQRTTQTHNKHHHHGGGAANPPAA